MLPERIEAVHWNLFMREWTADESVTINEAYILDENLLEPVHVLRPLNRDKAEEWAGKVQLVAQILRRVSDVCLQKKTITERERNEFHISVTAQEIYRALENNATSPQRMVVFFRHIEDLDQFESKMKPKFIDTDPETEILFDDLKNAIRDQLPAENRFNYRVCFDSFP
jgi:hypothetical protein